MRPEDRTPTHPGEILLEEFLKPAGITQVAFAAHLGVPLQRINRSSAASVASLRKPPGCSHKPSGPPRSSG